MTTESDAVLFARFPNETWGQPIRFTNREGKVRYGCKLCVGDSMPPWESLATDEGIVFAHIKKEHGLEPTPSLSPKEAKKRCKATGIDALTGIRKFIYRKIFLPRLKRHMEAEKKI